MKIGIDARLYGTKHRGLGRYVQKLVDGLIAVDHKNQYFLFFTRDNIEEPRFKSNKVKKILLDARWYSLKEQLLAAPIIKKTGVDLMHFPHFNAPLAYAGKYLVTIHDLIIDHFPDSRASTLPSWQYQLKLLAYKTILQQAIKRAEKIIAPSRFVKTDLISLYQVPPEKIKVIYEGYFLSDDQAAGDISRFKINKPYLLYVGAAYPHKNLERLIRVFKKLNQAHKYQLVLVGRIDKFYERLQKTIDDQDIILTGYVAEAELKSLYQWSWLYVFPSLYEGFGLPPIEAQAQGLPVAAANRSALPEVLSDSVIYFNPENEEEMLLKIKEATTNELLRKSLIAKGLENIKRFSWEKMVEETLELYQVLT